MCFRQLQSVLQQPVGAGEALPLHSREVAGGRGGRYLCNLWTNVREPALPESSPPLLSQRISMFYMRRDDLREKCAGISY